MVAKPAGTVGKGNAISRIKPIAVFEVFFFVMMEIKRFAALRTGGQKEGHTLPCAGCRAVQMAKEQMFDLWVVTISASS